MSDECERCDDTRQRLNWGMVGGQYIVAKDTERGGTLVGGLGVLGVGQMWFQTRDGHHDYPGWDEAPEREWKGGPWE